MDIVIIFDIITFGIAVIGFVLSIWNFIETRLQNRVSISVECKDFMIAEHLSRQPMYVALSITNKSHSQISISRILITAGTNTFEFSWIPQVVHQARLGTKAETYDLTIVKSITPPINLSGLGTCCGYFFAETFGKVSENQVQGTSASITLHTNRGIRKYPVQLLCISSDI